MITTTTTADGETTTTTDTLDFFYDASGTPFAVSVNGTTYYYITNLQGDVMQLVNASGTAVAAYEYDPYGNIVSATGDLAETNPLRYRGYYYDSETELYYLQSRYYDPQVGRFINADSLITNGEGLQGYNMFAYCNCNPVNSTDANGKDPVLFAAAGGALAGALISLFYYMQTSGDNASIGGALLAMSSGALAGALGGAAGMLTGDAQLACLLGAGIVSGLLSESTGGSFWVGAILGFLSSLAGTYIDISMFEGLTLSFASFVSTLGTGYPAEMVSQAIQQDIYEQQTTTPESPHSRTGSNRGSVGGSGGRKAWAINCIAYGL